MKKFNLSRALPLLLLLISVACARNLSAGQASNARDRRVDAQAEVADNLNTEAGTEMQKKPELVEQETKAFAVNGVPQITVDSYEGPIHVQGWDKPEVSFTASKQALDREAMSGIQLEASQRGELVSIVVKFNKPDRKVMFGKNQVLTKGAYVKLEINVPRNANLHLHTGDGPLNITGVNGVVDVRTDDGQIDVHNGSGRLQASTNDGLISILNFDGEVEATEMGDHGINLEGRFTKLTAQTQGAQISLGLPSNFDATIETDAEDVVNQGLSITPDAASSSSRDLRRLKIGRGGTVFNLRSINGKLVLRRIGRV